MNKYNEPPKTVLPPSGNPPAPPPSQRNAVHARVFDFSSSPPLQKALDEWLKENPNIEILQMSQSTYFEYGVMLTILYKNAEG